MKKLVLIFIVLLIIFTGCSTKLHQVHLESYKPIVGKSLSFKEIPSWESTDFALAFESFQKGCRLRRVPKHFKESCTHIDDNLSPKQFFETFFNPFLWIGNDEKETGLITGYYEPMLKGRSQKGENFTIPLLKKPKDLLRIHLGSVYPELKGKVYRGRVKDGTVVPYYSRKQITQDPNPEDILCWVNDKVDLFFLQIQGSGRIQLDDNKTLFVGYGDQNGHPYQSIGQYLRDKKYMQYHQMSLQGIKAWAIEHPDLIDEVLNQNQSYLFFQKNKTPAKGAMGVVLTPEHSLAVDTNYLPLGMPVFLTTSHPISKEPFSRLAIAQDRGSAIKGKQRVDFFWGFGEEAAMCAGRTKSQGELVLLLPKSLDQK